MLYFRVGVLESLARGLQTWSLRIGREPRRRHLDCDVFDQATRDADGVQYTRIQSFTTDIEVFDCITVDIS
jgi:hypothetical protein